MTERLHIGTHKGLFELARHNGVWDIADVQFLGDPVSAVLAVADGSVYAALDLGHFGAKLWCRNHTGNWRELPVPAFTKATSQPRQFAATIAVRVGQHNCPAPKICR